MRGSSAPLLATYRLQVRREFPLPAVTGVADYLGRLGVTHVYSSPLLKARPGSAHGYDVVDPTALNPELGTEADLLELVAALRRRSMGLVLDVVPNHMAAVSGNPFWEDVLEHGRASRYAGWFDIDWQAGEGRDRGRVLLPVLGDWFSRTLGRGELEPVREDGRFRVRYFENTFPLDPATIPLLLAPARAALRRTLGHADPHLNELETALTDLRALPAREPSNRETAGPAGPAPAWGPELSSPAPAAGPAGGSTGAGERRGKAEAALDRLRDLVERVGLVREEVDAALEAFRGAAGARRLRRLLDAQAYSLVHWRRARHEVNYRRFFDINELVGVRVEEEEVFAATHGLVLRWIERGVLDGLRVDHVDGLLDPLAYLVRLRAAVEARRGHEDDGLGSGGEPFWIVVEKILSGDERLREEWPVAGTTGYDFLNHLERIFVDPAGASRIEDAYRAIVPGPGSFRETAERSKRTVLQDLLATDVQRLALRLRRIARRHPSREPPRLQQLAAAIVETIVHLPVYRIYVDGRTPGPAEPDRRYLERALAGARAGGRATHVALDLLQAVLLPEARPEGPEGSRAPLETESWLPEPERLGFVQRFQQTSGPATAKGVEDTALYVYVPLASLNEVGGEPGAYLERAVDALHDASRERHRRWPRTLLCTSTHDTKRSGDARARLDVLSELPDLWLTSLARWRRMNRRHRRLLGGRRVPGPNTEYLLYQTLVAVWPLPPAEARPGGIPGPSALEGLGERVREYMRKAVREAKVRTSWIDPQKEFEDALDAYVDALLSPESAGTFLEELSRFVERVARPGLWNALSRTLVHLTTPGVPDLYQGDELWSFTLVDPDNRRPVDFALRDDLLRELRERFAAGGEARRSLIQEIARSPEDGRIKLHVTGRLLDARRRWPRLFLFGSYEALVADGGASGHVVAFARRGEDAVAVAIAPRLTTSLPGRGSAAPVGSGVWGGTTLRLPRDLAGVTWECALTGREAGGRDRDGSKLALEDVLEELPVALLVSR